MSTPTLPTRRRRGSSNAVQLAVLHATSRKDAFERLVALDPTIDILRSAARVFANAGKPIDIFDEFVAKRGLPPIKPVKGRSKPRVGEVRHYRPQTVRMPDGELSDPFIRLPVSTLALTEGASVIASFEPGLIRVALRPAPAVKPAA